ncbi:hypothetical protein DY000_02033041 [Brassica cretica]|uniref:Neprosin domain-containing protein n=1 Tax=Brassica cretica TaxID=69181 RepID=A0ABQ7DY01_BRACR|nr:hypothetical protein DY000_02033041 [Brassica cretica]
MTFNAMLNSPARLSQPHIHPDKINGALWFGIDPSVNSFIRATWQGYYMGPWRVGGRFLMKGGNHGGKGLWATHTRPDGTFLDYRAEELVTQAEMEATQLSNTEGSPGVQNAKGKRGHVYGLGSAQYREYAPSSRVPNGLARNLELEMRVGGLETSLQSVTADIAEVKQDVSEMKQDFAATRDGINQLLQTLRPQQAPTGQTSAQPQAPTTQP